MTTHNSRGYTAVELMLALSVLAVGSAGIITMERVTAQATRHAKALTTATRIAEGWIDQLVADSDKWKVGTTEAENYASTDWIVQQSRPDWFRPEYVGTRDWGPAFDMNGSPQRVPSANTVYCTDIRFKWLYPSVASSTQGGGLLRAEVRVYWARTSVPDLRIPLGESPCSWTALNVTSPEGLKAYHFVYMTTALLQHDQ